MHGGLIGLLGVMWTGSSGMRILTALAVGGVPCLAAAAVVLVEAGTEFVAQCTAGGEDGEEEGKASHFAGRRKDARSVIDAETG